MAGVRRDQRYSGVLAALSLFATLILYLHVQSVQDRLEEIQNALPTNKRLASRNFHGGHEHNFSFVYERVVQVYNATALNNTRKASKNMLFFNRVPKVGSQSLMVLLQILAAQNNFVFKDEAPKRFSQIQVPDAEEARLTSEIDSFVPPVSYVSHKAFCNFTKYGLSMPIYINFVRNPIDRVISWFYYIRAPSYIAERALNFPDLPLPDPAWLRKDFESCVLSGDPECSFIPGQLDGGMSDHQRQAMFFCGHQRSCRKFNNDWVIQQAKQNVEEHYAVVGVLERFDISLEVLESYIPRFFWNAPQVYQQHINDLSKVNRNSYKREVSENVRNLVKQNFTLEMEFYEFCRQRLHFQYRALFQLEDEEEFR